MELQEIRNCIYEIRGVQVMLDRDLAKMYGVETKRLNESVRRNIDRFPEDFMFELTNEECNLLENSSRSQIATLNKGRGSNIKYKPLAFTEEGVAMLSSVLRSKVAIEINIRIMRAFVAVRRMAFITPVISEEIYGIKRKMEELESSTLEAINDLSEDTRKELDNIYMALAQMANKLKDRANNSERKKIGYKK